MALSWDDNSSRGSTGMGVKRSFILALAFAVGGLLQADMPKAQELYKLGNAAYRQRDYRTAVDYYLQVIAEEPSYADYMDKPLGQAYLGTGDEGKALYHLNRAHMRNYDDTALAEQVKALEARDVLPDSSDTGKTLSGKRVRSHLIYFNTGDLARNSFSLGYEHAFSDHISGLIDGVYGAKEDSSSKFTTYGGGIGIHFTTERLGGGFIGPKFTYQQGSSSTTYTYSGYNYYPPYDYYTYTETVTTDLARYSIGMEGGYQWDYESGFVLALGYGIFYNQFTNGDPNNSYYYSSYYGGSSKEVQSNLLLNLGYAF